MFRYILFDLDGTLSDPKEGICKSVQYALEKMGIHESSLDALEPFIGPPLMDSFKEFYQMKKDDALKAVEFYRERFSAIGLYENKLYTGISELLDKLKDKGAFLGIASSKPTIFVNKILKYFKIDSYFDVVVGSELDGTRSTKEEVVEEALKQLSDLDNRCVHVEDNFGVEEDGSPKETLSYKASLDYKNTVLVGDRKFDIEAARKYGIYSVGVLYGYASKGELKKAGANDIARDVPALTKVLLTRDGRDIDFSAYAQEEAEESAKQKNSMTEKKRLKDSKEANGDDKERPLDGLAYPKPLSEISFMRAVYMILPLMTFWAIRYGLIYLIYIFFYEPYIKNQLDIFNGGSFYDTFAAIEKNANFDALVSLLVALLAGVLISLFYKKSDPVRVKPTFHFKKGLLFVLLGMSMSKGLNLLISFICMQSPKLAMMYSNASYAGTTNFWLGLATYVLITPLLEEIAFRWLFFGRTRRVLGVPLALFCSSLVFGIYHGSLVQGIYAFIMGMVLAYVYEKTGSLFSSILVHMSANFIIFVLAYVPKNIQNVCNSVPALFISLLMAGGVWYFMRRAQK